MDAESARPRRERMVVCIFGEGRGGWGSGLLMRTLSWIDGWSFWLMERLGRC
jgi:hypothetical protein